MYVNALIETKMKKNIHRKFQREVTMQTALVNFLVMSCGITN